MSSLFKSYKPPSSVNVAAVGQQQTQQNTANANQQTAFNRPNQTNQYGNTSSWQQTGSDVNGNPTFAQNTNLGATGQQFAGGFANLGNDYFSGAQNFLNNRPDMSGMAAFGKANDLWSSINEPRLDQARSAQENKLRNQGLDPSSEAYKNSMSDLSLQQDQARQNFQLGAQGQMFNQGQQDWQNQISQFTGLTQPGVQYGGNAINSGFQSVPGVNVGNVDYTQLNNQNYQQQMDAYKANTANQNAQWGALGGLAGTAMGLPIGGGASLGGAFLGGLANIKPNNGYTGSPAFGTGYGGSAIGR